MLPRLARLILSGFMLSRSAASTFITICIMALRSVGARSVISFTCACQITRQKPGYCASSTSTTRN
jgi:hypothetical protein